MRDNLFLLYLGSLITFLETYLKIPQSAGYVFNDLICDAKAHRYILFYTLKWKGIAPVWNKYTYLATAKTTTPKAIW